jgi:hypothetical protein
MRLIFALSAQKLSAFQKSPFRNEAAKLPMLRILSSCAVAEFIKLALLRYFLSTILTQSGKK